MLFALFNGNAIQEKAMELVFGTGNKHKGIELADILLPVGMSIKTLADFPEHIDIVEDGNSFEENAAKKATQQARHLDRWVLAEDSGISVPALGGAPGIYSARFSGPDATDEQNNLLLLEKLAGYPAEQRTAFYSCFMVLSDPEGNVRFKSEGRCYGRILLTPLGSNGFGYDPLFEVVEYHKTFGELAPAVKRVISHRARAGRQLIPKLFELIDLEELK